MWTQADLDAVQTALATGQRRVRFADGREIEQQTTKDLLALRQQIKAELATTATAKPLRRATVARMGRRR